MRRQWRVRQTPRFWFRGAGFVGSNLVRQTLEDTQRRLAILDNLRSADTSNIPEIPEIDFRGSVADDQILKAVPDKINYGFHFAC